MSEKLGFVGLGIMGGGMVLNLLKAGFEVTVWNRTASKTETAVAAGATAVATPREVAENSDVVFVCVGNTVDVEAVIFDKDGLIEGLRAGMLVVDNSTISPDGTREIATKLNGKGIHMLDAPISGGNEGAANGTLSIMIGGEEDQVARAMPYFEVMGKTITHVGGQGKGQSVKLVNQILCAGSMICVGEALLFAEASGLDLDKTLQAISGGAAGSWTLSKRGPQVIERDWRPGFTIDFQQKDLRLVMDAADEVGAPLLLTSMVFNLYRTLQARGLGQEGNHAIVKALEMMAGVEVGSSE